MKSEITNFRVDLHSHSIFSDGTCSPQELIYLAKENNLKGLSITDHDTVQAYNDDLFKLAKSQDIILITGVEISSEHLDLSVHILGYNFDINSPGLKFFLKEVQKRRKARNIQILKKLSEKGMIITIDELNDFAKRKKGVSKTTLGRPHIAQLMHEKGFANSMQDGFNKYIKDNGPCYVAGEKFPVNEVIDQLHNAGGKAILAHPNLLKKHKIINELLQMNFDGLEAYYSKLSLDQEKQWVEIAEKNKWLITGGSDFHGEIKPYITLGCSWVDENALNKLIQ